MKFEKSKVEYFWRMIKLGVPETECHEHVEYVFKPINRFFGSVSKLEDALSDLESGEIKHENMDYYIRYKTRPRFYCSEDVSKDKEMSL